MTEWRFKTTDLLFENNCTINKPAIEKLNEFIETLLKKQRENCKDEYVFYQAKHENDGITISEAILNAPEPEL